LKYAYDHNGNMITRTMDTETFSFTYDAENRITEVSGDAEMAFVYDGDGRMVEKIEGYKTTVYIGNYFEIEIFNQIMLPIVLKNAGGEESKAMNGGSESGTSNESLDPYPGPGEETEPSIQEDELKAIEKSRPLELAKTAQSGSAKPPSGQTWRSYYFVGSIRVAMRVQEANGSSQVHYLLSDHLGSTSLTVDENGDRIAELRYAPWGEVRYSWGTTPTDYTYTGQRSQVNDFGLMYYNARWYAPYLWAGFRRRIPSFLVLEIQFRGIDTPS
jgi:YD repeat-containing protein